MLKFLDTKLKIVGRAMKIKESVVNSLHFTSQWLSRDMFHVQWSVWCIHRA